jgi:hypothetical protein
MRTAQQPDSAGGLWKPNVPMELHGGLGPEGGINVPPSVQGFGGDQSAFGGGMPYGWQLDRRAFDRASTNNVNVNGTGSLRVDVNAPQGTRVNAQGGGLFQNIEMNRSVQMEHARTGSMFNTEGPNSPPIW